MEEAGRGGERVADSGSGESVRAVWQQKRDIFLDNGPPPFVTVSLESVVVFCAKALTGASEERVLCFE